MQFISRTTIAGGIGSTVAGGVNNTANGDYASVGGGQTNSASGDYSTAAGGENNLAEGWGSGVGGGFANLASDQFSNVGGGYQNVAVDQGSTVGGGMGNYSSGFASTITGGYGNGTTGDYSMIPGGASNIAKGAYSFAGGLRAFTDQTHEGSFVWSDGDTGNPNTYISSTGPRQFIVHASGGLGFGTSPTKPWIPMTIGAPDANPLYSSIHLHGRDSTDGILLTSGDANAGQNNASFYVDQYNGSVLTRRLSLDATGKLTISNQAYKPGGGSWAASSDSRLKTHVQPISHALDHLLALKGVTFEYAHPDGAMHPAGKFSGFIAQDVEKVFPSWIGHDENGYLTVGPQGFEALAVEALRELRMSEIEHVAALERDNAELREIMASQATAIADLRREVATISNSARIDSKQLASSMMQ
jgi:hypothetical protein